MLIASQAATAQANEEIVFIDAGVPDMETLRAGLRPRVDAVMLGAARPALAQIADTLKHRHDVAAIHVIAHGEPGKIRFASGSLSLATVDGHRDDLATIGRALAHDGEIRLWACETAHGPHGAAFLAGLADATGARVRGSSGRVGAASQGGRWQLDGAEGGGGLPPLAARAIAMYPGVLDAPTLTVDDPLIDSTEVTAVPFTIGGGVFGGSVTFIGNLGNTTSVSVNSQTSYTVDLSGFGRYVTSQLNGVQGSGPDVHPFPTVYGNTVIVATDPNLVLSISEFNSIPLSEWQGNPAYTSVTVADDGAAISALTKGQLDALASDGVDALQATSGDLILTRPQYLHLGAITLGAAGEVVLAETGGQFAALTVPQLTDLAAAGVDRIDATNELTLSVAQFQALGSVALTGSDVVTLADVNANFAGLDFATLAGIDKINATGDNTLTINVAQSGALGAGLTLTGRDVVTLADSGNALTGLASLSAGAIAALAGNGIDKMDATDNALPLSVDQFNALGRVALSADDVLTLTGTAGDDNFNFAHQPFSVADHIDGGAGHDALALEGDYGPLAFQAGTMTNIEKLSLGAGHDYSLTLADANVAAGHHLRVAGGNLGALDSLAFDGSAETDGSFRLIGGAGADTFKGGDGGDLLSGGGGADTFVYSAPSQSTSTTHDTVTDFKAGQDRFDFDRTVSQMQNFSGTVNSGSFDSNLGFILDDAIAFQSAAVVSVNGGDLAGHSLLVVAASSFYQAGSDYVIDITGFTGTLTAANLTHFT